MLSQKILLLSKNFLLPLLVLVGILLYFLMLIFHFQMLASIIILTAIILGSYELVIDTFQSILRKHFALDYIAILAILVSLLTHEYLVAAIISLMIASGRTLEAYGAKQAKKSLTKLVDRIPSDVVLLQNDQQGKKVNISAVKVGQKIMVRKGEVIPLDGILVSDNGLTDESSLTGEPYTIEKVKGDIIRSGTVNMGNPIVIDIKKEEKDSTYKKIITMVQEAQNEKAPLIRLADKYSTIFTIITFIIAGFAYLFSKDFKSVLAVLVIATPCPLIIATPIALLGGVNAAAKKRIIIKKLASLEVLSRITALVFDKTGTITLGKPSLIHIEIKTAEYTEQYILSIASAIERNSLHPLAKAIVQVAHEKKASVLIAENISEHIGQGIQAKVNNKVYTLAKADQDTSSGMGIILWEGKNEIARFQFRDEIKKDSIKIIKRLKQLGFFLYIFTGDKQKAAKDVIDQLGENVIIHAELTPEDKKAGIQKLKKEKKVICMIGDGINDAPALALADVGMVFSNEEQTAASEAADIVLLGGDFSLVYETYGIAKRTIHIALQSIMWGIGASIIGMLFASVGLIPPLVGAGLQEAIDVAVILNALRASR